MNPRKPFRLTPEQYERLTMPLDTNRIGKNPKGFSHLEAWDVRRWLVRVFGFGAFDVETISLDLVKEIEHPIRRRTNKKGEEYGDPYTPWTVVYRAQVRLTVWDQHGGYVVLEDGACGDASNQPSVGDAHDNAAKTALSQALKRCAVNLGDCFGLSLYNNGATKPVVVRSLVAPEVTSGEAPAVALPTDDAPVMPEPGTVPVVDEHQGEPTAVAPERAADRPVSAPPQEARPVSGVPQQRQGGSTPAAAEPRPAPTANGLRDWALKSDRTALAVRQALTRLLTERPEMAAARVTNEHGDDEQLSVLMDRKARELSPPAPEQAAPSQHEERRRKRMFALLTELGYGDRAAYHQVFAHVLTREVASSKDLTAADTEDVIAALELRQKQLRNQASAVPA